MARMLLLYDGECRMCVEGSARLVRLAQAGAIELVNLHDRATLSAHPHAPQNPDASTLRLVMPDGRVAGGAEAIALALGTRRAWRWVTWIYWLPVVRALTDALYGLVARNRFRIMGRAGGGAGSACASGACAAGNKTAGGASAGG